MSSGAAPAIKRHERLKPQIRLSLQKREEVRHAIIQLQSQAGATTMYPVQTIAQSLSGAVIFPAAVIIQRKQIPEIGLHLLQQRAQVAVHLNPMITVIPKKAGIGGDK